MTHDLETLCGLCGHRRGLHAVNEISAERLGCNGRGRTVVAGAKIIWCGCSRRQDDPHFAEPELKAVEP